jgi:hypothetical protein
MSYNHKHHEVYNIEEYLQHKRKIHLNILEKDKNIKKILVKNLKQQQQHKDTNAAEEKEEEYNLTTNPTLLDPNNELPVNTELFCPILGPAERARIIKSNIGIDESESQDIASVRKSREQCGCTCKDVCEKETCLCILNGIGCQLDKTRFPCSCSIRRCKNPNGVKRFDQRSVRKHYDHVLYPEYYKLNYENGSKKMMTNEEYEDDDDDDYEVKKVKKRGRKIKRKTKVVSKPASKIVVNRCLDVLPYEPFDLSKFVLKFKSLQEIPSF